MRKWSRKRIVAVAIASIAAVVVVAVVVALTSGISSDNEKAASNSVSSSVGASVSSSPSASPSAFAGTAAPSTLRGTISPSLAPSEAPSSLMPSLDDAKRRNASVVLALLPDTQYYSEGAPYIFEAQTKWLAAHASELQIPFVFHLGDLVQNPGRTEEWSAANASMMQVTKMANLSYSVVTGNHDLQNRGEDTQRDPNRELYLDFVSASVQHRPTLWKRDSLGYSEIHSVVLASQEFVVLALDWRASNSTLEWAQEVLEQDFANTPTILVSHEFLYPVDTAGKTLFSGAAHRTAYAEGLWKDFIGKNDQIFLVLCGHIPGTGLRVDYNDFNHSVISVLVDYQDMHAGGNGYMRLIELDFEKGRMHHMSFSPFVMDLYQQNGVNALGPSDVVQLTDETNDFTVHYDFQMRFQQMNVTLPSEWANGNNSTTNATSLLDPLRSTLSDIPLPPPDNRSPAINSQDYPRINETLAHWRFVDSKYPSGSPFNISTLVFDLTGNGNDLYREDVRDGQDDFLFWSDEHHRLSASPGSICFANPTRDEGSFLTTGPDVPLSAETFPDGFTFEAFVKLAPSWANSTAHRWTGVVSRAGEGQDAVGNNKTGDVNEPLAVLGFSPWREVQFASYPENTPDLTTSWSSPLQVNVWYHLAVVNDGINTRLLIDGYPARRDPVHSEIQGIATGFMGWRVGAATYNRRVKVFGGCIGEVRIVGRALRAEDEFLIARNVTQE